MTCAERIRIISLIKKMEAQPEFSKKIGLENKSSFKRQVVTTVNRRKEEC